MAATALRVRSAQYLDILATQASRGEHDWESLSGLLASEKVEDLGNLDPIPLGELGRVLLLYPQSPEGSLLGRVALERAISCLPANLSSRSFRELLVDHLIETEDDSLALELLDTWPDIDRVWYSYRRAELQNPSRKSGGDRTAWLDAFNAPFREMGLSEVVLSGEEEKLFDQLSSSTLKPHESSTPHVPRVSVVLSVFNPDQDALQTSIDSILQQTLTDLELIVVDDGSSEIDREYLSALQKHDRRVRCIFLPENAGTYAARNVGFSEAKGEFITGQDDDDWSHPQRLELQVAAMENNSAISGCRVLSIACREDLSRVRISRKPNTENASSLMMRRVDFESIGGFFEARKAADTELRMRLELFTKKPVLEISSPLSVIRIAPQSLSRNDFAPGWRHPSRISFRSSYERWHATSDPQELTTRAERSDEVRVPQKLQMNGSDRRARHDVILGGDWRQWGGPQKSMLEEIHALKQTGMTVAILHMEAARFMTRRNRGGCPADSRPHKCRRCGSSPVRRSGGDRPADVEVPTYTPVCP